MICKSCGAENKDWASYCTQCGLPLGDVCRCSFVNEPGDLYCGGCGKPLMPNENDNLKRNPSSMNVEFGKMTLSESQIKKLIRESLLIKTDDEENISQKDIDLIFSMETESASQE
ncbi:hypothetical protein B6D60_01195 [candidate division KSB1 bacterium 4484_87]|nr:MAG: hypothetical protein B6D60_01195 [candidate division KSB1 bacterium 4484_87]